MGLVVKMSTIPEIVPFSETIGQTAQEGLGVGGQVIAQSEMPEIGHSVETSQPGQVIAKWEMPEIGHSVETSQAGEEGLGAGGQVIAKWEMPEIGHSVETSQAGEEGLGAGGQVITKWEMPEIGHSVETSQLGQEGLRLGQDVRMSTMPEVGQSDVETSQPVCCYSFSRVHLSSFPRRVIKLQVWGLRLLEVCIMYTQ